MKMKRKDTAVFKNESNGKGERERLCVFVVKKQTNRHRGTSKYLATLLKRLSLVFPLNNSMVQLLFAFQ